MSDVSVDVIADQDAGGGHAVIRLNGIYLLPPQSGFRIEPLDDGDAAAEGWPSGEHRPQDVRVTTEGVELLVGPDIVDSPALQPGTPVVVSVPAVDVRSEIRWPTLAVSMAPRRRAVIVSAAQRAAEAAAAKARADAEARAKLEAEETARLEAEARQRAIEDRVRREEDERAQKIAAEKVEAEARLRAESTAALEEKAREVAELRARSEARQGDKLKAEEFEAAATAKRVADEVEQLAADHELRSARKRRNRSVADAMADTQIQTEGAALAPAQPPSTPDEPEWAKAARDAAARLASIETAKTSPPTVKSTALTSATTATPQATSIEPSPAPAGGLTAVQPSGPAATENDPRGLAKLDLGRNSSANPTLTGEAGPSPVPPPSSMGAPTAGPIAPSAAAPAPAKASVPKTVEELPPLPQRRSSVMPFLMGMLLPIAIGAAGFYAFSRNANWPTAPAVPQPATQAAAPSTVATGSIPAQAAQRSAPSATLAPALGELVKVGETSPRGRQAKSVDLAQALALADRNLHGVDQAVDREEARFWLRKALSLSLHTEQMTWAVTQLGAMYATPVGSEQPDYEKARALWEISGANGDPVAHCFIASLFEHGLGVAADKKSALKHFTEAQRLGGCRGVEQAIARVSQ